MMTAMYTRVFIVCRYEPNIGADYTRRSQTRQRLRQHPGRRQSVQRGQTWRHGELLSCHQCRSCFWDSVWRTNMGKPGNHSTAAVEYSCRYLGIWIAGKRLHMIRFGLISNESDVAGLTTPVISLCTCTTALTSTYASLRAKKLRRIGKISPCMFFCDNYTGSGRFKTRPSR